MWASHSCSGSWENRNYIRTNEIWYAGKTTFIEADNIPIGQKQQSTTYYDGLGRTEQSISMGTSPDGKDVVTPMAFDAIGRQLKGYLPYTAVSDGKFKNNAIIDQKAFYDDPTTGLFPGETNFYSESQVEESPLNRAIKELSPGSNWGGNNVGINSNYQLNTKNGDAVRIWTIEPFNSSSIPTSGTNDIYEDNSLYKFITTDERGKQLIEYKDMSGRLILKKQQKENSLPTLTGSHGGWICTYYVYDDFGRLRFAVSPKAVEKMNIANDWTISQQMADGLCYKYLFDFRGRIIEKKLPDADPIYMVYDNRDRLVLSQDGNQRAGKTNEYGYKEWAFFIYDVLDRSILTGSILDNVANYSRSQLQAIVDNPSNNTTEVTINYQTESSETQTAFNPVPIFSNNIAIQFFEKRINNVDYYDQQNAAFFNSVTMAYANNFENIDIQNPTNRTRGMLTSSKDRVLNGTLNTYIFSRSIYDEKARLIQSSRQNYPGGNIATTNQYDFTGKIRSSVYQQTLLTPITQFSNTSDSYTILTINEYDHAGRLLKIKKNFTNSFYTPIPPEEGPNPRVVTTGERTIIENTYNKIGNLVSKKLAPGYNNPNGNNYLEKLDYEYNIRGWITGINKNYLQNSSSSGTFFGMEIGYDRPGNSGFSNTLLNGNISGVSWKTAGDNTPRKYDFLYDNANRLANAAFSQRNSYNTTSWTNDKIDYTVSGMQYDLNGNILHMEQKGVSFSGIIPMDNMDYGYDVNKNKLEWVAENASIGTTDYKLGDFTDKNTGANNVDYDYDNNGNLIKDKNKNIDNIVYNSLNLPQTIFFQSNNKIEYVYDATGTKLQKIVTDNTGSSTVVNKTTYSGEIIYTPSGNYISFEEGRVRFANDPATGALKLVFDYFVKDYQNNVRMILTEETGQFPYPVATMENAVASFENKYYTITNRNDKPAELLGNPQAIQDQYNLRYGQKMSKLTSLGSGNKIGPSILLKVMAGDAVHAKTDYYYLTNGTQINSNTLAQDLANQLLLHLNGGQAGAAAKAESNIISNGVQSSDLIIGSTGMINQQNSTFVATKPKAFLNYIVFDEQFNVIDKGFKQVENPGPLQPPVFKNDIPVTKNGWIYVFANNESEQAVYFDNFQVTHTKGNLVEENHYYPFGLTMKAISPRALNIVPINTNKYASKDLQAEEFSNGQGLDAYDFGARFYDQQIGRWTSIDPMSESFHDKTPFNYSLNNPLVFNDPDGRSVYTPPGDYYDDYGWIGNDGINDNRAYYVGGLDFPWDNHHNPAGLPDFWKRPMGTWGKKITLLTVTENDLEKYAATVYGESSAAFETSVVIPGEIFGLASAIDNAKTYFNLSTYSDAINKTGARAGQNGGSEAYKDFMKKVPARNYTQGMQYALAGAVNAIRGGPDYAGGAFKWDGRDAPLPGRKWSQGLQFTNKNHDIFNLGDKKVPGMQPWYNEKGKPTTERGRWDYKWESTAAYSRVVNGKTYGTIFMKLTAAYLKPGNTY